MVDRETYTQIMTPDQCSDIAILLKWGKDKSKPGVIKTSMYDIGGQKHYVFLHSLFIGENTGILLVVNLQEYNPSNHHKLVGKWHQSPIAERAGAKFLIVATHWDECGLEAEKKFDHLKQTVDQETKKMCEYLTLQIEKYQTAHCIRQKP